MRQWPTRSRVFVREHPIKALFAGVALVIAVLAVVFTAQLVVGIVLGFRYMHVEFEVKGPVRQAGAVAALDAIPRAAGMRANGGSAVVCGLNLDCPEWGAARSFASQETSPVAACTAAAEQIGLIADGRPVALDQWSGTSEAPVWASVDDIRDACVLRVERYTRISGRIPGLDELTVDGHTPMLEFEIWGPDEIAGPISLVLRSEYFDYAYGAPLPTGTPTP